MLDSTSTQFKAFHSQGRCKLLSAEQQRKRDAREALALLQQDADDGGELGGGGGVEADPEEDDQPAQPASRRTPQQAAAAAAQAPPPPLGAHADTAAEANHALAFRLASAAAAQAHAHDGSESDHSDTEELHVQAAAGLASVEKTRRRQCALGSAQCAGRPTLMLTPWMLCVHASVLFVCRATAVTAVRSSASFSCRWSSGRISTM